jgi:tripartite-type tricarboxylate transporter receptor subunit TctC
MRGRSSGKANMLRQGASRAPRDTAAGMVGALVMRIHRRQFLQFAGAAVAAPALPKPASALDYPTRPVHLIVGFPAGGTSDIFARLTGQWLSQRLGQPFVIENRPGASGNIAVEAVVNARPDGHTLLAVGANNTINATFYEKTNFDFIRDIAPVASSVRIPLVMVINPSVPAQTVPEFIAYAKANAGRLNMASGGNGSPQHVSGELFKMMTGVDMLHVPYRGGAPAITALIGGQVQVMFNPIAESIEHIRAGRLRALAMTTSTRSDALPDLPTVADFVPGYEASIMNGVGAPKGTPAEIIDKLNQEINAALADATIRARLADLGGTVLPGSPAGFAKLLADETEKWGKVVKFSGAKPG